MRWAWYVARMGEERVSCSVLVWKLEIKSYRRRWEDNTVEYLLKESTVEAEKQPLLGNAGTQQQRCHDTWRVQPLFSSARSIRVRDDDTQQ
jgi:hypothetical protein